MSTVSVAAENRVTGKYQKGNVTVSAKQETFAKLLNDHDGIQANYLSVDGNLPQGVTVYVGPPNNPNLYQLSTTPTQIGDQPIEISKWVVDAKK